MNNELDPFPLSSFRLEVNDPRNCSQVLADTAGFKGLLALASTHYMGFDNPDDAKLAAFTWYGSGLRIADVCSAHAVPPHPPWYREVMSRQPKTGR
jgi:hypothetical protein